VLSAQNAGISKKKGGNLKRSQRVRAQKAMERAADDMDKWELKKAKSIQKAATIKDRAKLWDDINGESKSKKNKSAFAVLAEDGGEESKSGRQWGGDEEMDEASTKEGKVQDGGKAEGVEASASVAMPVEEDELL
jgi:hypothetical protein